MKDRQVRLLWLYPDLLDLYGETGNIMALGKRLAQMGFTLACRKVSLGDEVDFEKPDMIYVGAGKTRNLVAAMQDLESKKDGFLRAVERGTLVLATGSGKALLGRGIDVEGQEIPGVGLFDYQARETGEVFVSDCVVEPLEASVGTGRMIGFINQTLRFSYQTKPNLFRIVFGQGDTGTAADAEGMTVHNCFATSLLGPILAKNPSFLRAVCSRLLGSQMGDYDDRLAQTALERTLKEFEG